MKALLLESRDIPMILHSGAVPVNKFTPEMSSFGDQYDAVTYAPDEWTKEFHTERCTTLATGCRSANCILVDYAHDNGSGTSMMILCYATIDQAKKAFRYYEMIINLNNKGTK